MGALNILDILRCYASCSGQLTNFGKSSIFFSSNVHESIRTEVVRILGVSVADNIEKYLGLPCMVGRSKLRAFAVIRDKIKARISSWTNRVLSIGGREVLIKAVLQSIPTFAMSYFLLPKSFCKELEALLAQQKSHNKRGIHWCEWTSLCQL